MDSLGLLDATKYVGIGFALMTSSISQVHQSFKSTMDNILSQLNENEKDQVIALNFNYTCFLMKTREFVCCTMIGLTHATTLNGICDAIDINDLNILIEDVKRLLDIFEKVHVIIKNKITSKTSLKSFAKIMSGTCGLGLGLVAIGAGCGKVLPNIMKPVAVVGASKAVISGTAALLAFLANKSSKFDEIIENLEEIKSCLVTIADQQSQLKGDHKGYVKLCESDRNDDQIFVENVKKTFIDTLKKTHDEVTKGFNNVKTLNMYSASTY